MDCCGSPRRLSGVSVQIVVGLRGDHIAKWAGIVVRCGLVGAVSRKITNFARQRDVCARADCIDPDLSMQTCASANASVGYLNAGACSLNISTDL